METTSSRILFFREPRHRKDFQRNCTPKEVPSPRTWPGPESRDRQGRDDRGSQSHRSSPARRTGTHTCGGSLGFPKPAPVQERFVASIRGWHTSERVGVHQEKILRKRRALRAQDSIPRYATLCPSKTSSSFPPARLQ